MSTFPVPARVAVIGAGYFGRFHFDAWSRIDGAELVAICEKDPDGAAPIAEQYGNDAPLPVFTSATEMVDALQADIVDITAPPAAHLPLIGELSPMVGHIVCQKPFCGGLDGANQAIEIARRQGTQIAIHENVRFQPWYREAKRLIDAGTFGDLYQVTFRLRPGDGQGPEAYLDRQPYFQTMPRLLVHETAIHWIDTFRYLLGEPEAVYADLKKLNPAIAGEDAGTILFDFPANIRAVFDANRLSDHVAENRRLTMGELVIEGSSATLRLDGNARLWLRNFGENIETEHAYKWTDHLFAGDCVHETTRHIFEAWSADETPETEASLYIRNQELEESVYSSAKEGRRIAA